jgi:hypothetical protein
VPFYKNNIERDGRFFSKTQVWKHLENLVKKTKQDEL